MSNIHHISKTCLLGSAVAFVLAGWCGAADAKKPPFQVVHSFDGTSDGSYSFTGLLSDGAGDFYGTASQGGNTGCNGFGCGTVFKIAPDGTETVLHEFSNYSDGAVPYGGLIQDAAGNLYSTTYEGGTYNAGIVYEVAPNGTETVLYSFTGGSDGANPESTLVMDKAGNLYGTAAFGGTGCCNGTVFKLAPNGTETTLYQFTGGTDGGEPGAGVILDKAGNLYGTTTAGGLTSNCYPIGCGTVFKVTPGGTESVLYTFTGGNDGGQPAAALIKDKAGNFYGTTTIGGATGNGVVFKLAPDGTETVLYAFQGGSDGSWPYAALKLDKAGNLFGTTYYGGASGCGTVYEISPSGTETILYTFQCGSDGASPASNLTLYRGHLYGTTANGGLNDCAGGCGVVFSVKGR